MTAYLIVDITVHDLEQYQEYVSAARAHAEALLEDPEYQAIAAIRHASTTSRLVIADGYDIA